MIAFEANFTMRQLFCSCAAVVRQDFQKVLVDRQKRRSYAGGEAKFGTHKIGAMSWCLAEVLFQQDREFIRRSTCTPDCSRKFLLFIR